MKKKIYLTSLSFVAMLTLLLLGITVVFAADSNLGTWKLNEAKSKFSKGATKNHTVVYETVGDQVKITTDGTDGEAKPIHAEWTGKYDGKDYPVTGSPSSDARSYKKIDDRTTEFTVKKDGKVVTTGRVVVAPDGKSRTVTTSGTDAQGNKISATAVYDKQ